MLVWIIFIAAILFFLALDLGVFNKTPHIISSKEAGKWTGIFVTISFLFSGVIYWIYQNNYIENPTNLTPNIAVMKYITGYLIELSLSVDNIFVIDPNKLINSNGFPEERNIDLNYLGIKSSRNKPNYAYSFGNNKAKLILLHYYSYPRDKRHNQLLKSEVLKGNLQPEIYASIIDFQSKFSNTDEYYNEWHQTEDSSKFENVNKRRIEIGLLPFEEKALKYKRGQKICKEKRENKTHKQVRLFYWCG